MTPNLTATIPHQGPKLPPTQQNTTMQYPTSKNFNSSQNQSYNTRNFDDYTSTSAYFHYSTSPSTNDSDYNYDDDTSHQDYDYYGVINNTATSTQSSSKTRISSADDLSQKIMDEVRTQHTKSQTDDISQLDYDYYDDINITSELTTQKTRSFIQSNDVLQLDHYHRVDANFTIPRTTVNPYGDDIPHLDYDYYDYLNSTNVTSTTLNPTTISSTEPEDLTTHSVEDDTLQDCRILKCYDRICETKEYLSNTSKGTCNIFNVIESSDH